MGTNINPYEIQYNNNFKKLSQEERIQFKKRIQDKIDEDKEKLADIYKLPLGARIKKVDFVDKYEKNIQSNTNYLNYIKQKEAAAHRSSSKSSTTQNLQPITLASKPLKLRPLPTGKSRQPPEISRRLPEIQQQVATSRRSPATSPQVSTSRRSPHVATSEPVEIVFENGKINTIIYYIDLRSLYLYKFFTKIFQILIKLNLNNNLIIEKNFNNIKEVDQKINDYVYLLGNKGDKLKENNSDISINNYKNISFNNISEEDIIQKIKEKIKEQNEHIGIFLKNLQNIFDENEITKFKEWIENQDDDGNFLQIKKAIVKKKNRKYREELEKQVEQDESKTNLKLNNLSISSNDQEILDNLGDIGDIDDITKDDIDNITKVYSYDNNDNVKINDYISSNNEFFSEEQDGGGEKRKRFKELLGNVKNNIKYLVNKYIINRGSVAPLPIDTKTPHAAHVEIDLAEKKIKAIKDIEAEVEVQHNLTVDDNNNIIEDIEKEVVNDIDIIYKYIEKDITDFITVADIAFKYIDIFSIYLDREHDIPLGINKLFIYGFFNSLNNSRDFYQKKLDELKDDLIIITDDVPYVSIYIEYREIEKELKKLKVQSLGGRKRSIRKPRKNTNGTVKKVVKAVVKKTAKTVVKKTSKAVVKKTSKAVVKKTAKAVVKK
uniref:Uncharacterized protein n=1 Tax=viral metagenome TaxID=1070528 RepID=A0A6C0LCV1_9ZZZZ